MGFLKTVAALGYEEESVLDSARTALAKCVLMGDQKSPKFITALARWRLAWKAFYGFALDKAQEKLYLEVLSERDEQQMKEKKA